MGKQCAKAVLMVRPTDFSFNVQTAIDNEFQHFPEEPAQTVNVRAMTEFAHAVRVLRHAGVVVVVVEKTDDLPQMPDAVFPNNWLVSTEEGLLHTFPMFAHNRRCEKLLLPRIEAQLAQEGYQISGTLQVGHYQENQDFLEGTGSMVIDHQNKTIYAALSERTSMRQLENYKNLGNFKDLHVFNTQSHKGHPFYHTNVMMSIGEGFALVCLESVASPEERKALESALRATGRELISISLEQAENNLCGNVLQVQNQEGEYFVVLSKRAFDALDTGQVRQLQKHGQLLSVAIPTIEHVGGGSIRCMMAELFLPKN